MSITQYGVLATTQPAALFCPNRDLSNRIRAQLEALNWPGTIEQYTAIARESIFATVEIAEAHAWLAQHDQLKL